MFIMQKRKLLLLIGCLLLTSCGQYQNTNVETKGTQEQVDSKNTVQTSLDSIETGALTAETEKLDAERFFSDDNKLKLVDFIVNEPVYEIVMENSEKTYGETVEESYPNITIDSQGKFANVGWWQDGNQVHLEVWNYNHESEMTFYLDGSKCQVTFPELDFEEKKIDKKISESGDIFLVESMNRYKKYLSLNIKQEEGDRLTLPSKLSIKMNDKNYKNVRTEFDDTTGEIFMLYKIEDGDLESSAKIEEILYNETPIVTLE